MIQNFPFPLVMLNAKKKLSHHSLGNSIQKFKPSQAIRKCETGGKIELKTQKSFWVENSGLIHIQNKKHILRLIDVFKNPN